VVVLKTETNLGENKKDHKRRTVLNLVEIRCFKRRIFFSEFYEKAR